MASLGTVGNSAFLPSFNPAVAPGTILCLLMSTRTGSVPTCAVRPSITQPPCGPVPPGGGPTQPGRGNSVQGLHLSNLSHIHHGAASALLQGDRCFERMHTWQALACSRLPACPAGSSRSRKGLPKSQGLLRSERGPNMLEPGHIFPSFVHPLMQQVQAHQVAWLC